MKITNNKYVLLGESLKAMKENNIDILTLYGSPGSGKTHTTLEYLKENGINYTYINSYATPLSFYNILYESRNKKIVIFDDLHNVSNPLILAMLKAACWASDGKKIVSYHSTSDKLEKMDLPESFEFDSNVVLIFNNLISGYEPITNRGITIEFCFNFEDKIKIFEEIKKDAEIEEDVLDYVKKNCSDATENLSIRTLVILSRIERSKGDYKLFAKEILKTDRNKAFLIDMTCKEWCDETGMHRRTYFKHKHKYGIK